MTDTLWEFSIATYRRPGVEAACLALQDNLGADVNILMYSCWHGALAPQELQALLAAVAPWQSDIVGNLRAVRRALKPMLAELGDLGEDAGALRRKVAALELEAEKLQQAVLAAHASGNAGTGPTSPQTARQNLAHYFQILAKTPDQKALDTLVNAAFANAGEPDQTVA